ncbi:MAG: molybdopterin-guanine dinucleotide biosynthesis protein B [Rubrivivax sp.]
MIEPMKILGVAGHSGIGKTKLLERLQRCDLVRVEGFKNGDFPKLEVWRTALGKAMLWPPWPGIVAVASDTRLPTPDATRLDLADTVATADFVRLAAAAR